MTDHGHADRQAFIDRENDRLRNVPLAQINHDGSRNAYRSSLEAKREALRERMHAEKKALVGEEVFARANGLQVYHHRRKWSQK